LEAEAPRAADAALEAALEAPRAADFACAAALEAPRAAARFIDREAEREAPRDADRERRRVAIIYKLKNLILLKYFISTAILHYTLEDFKWNKYSDNFSKGC
jgi:hypothetical protein